MVWLFWIRHIAAVLEHMCPDSQYLFPPLVPQWICVFSCAKITLNTQVCSRQVSFGQKWYD